jgi:CubicO group peptidase (beta-lactamase class C family)
MPLSPYRFAWTLFLLFALCLGVTTTSLAAGSESLTTGKDAALKEPAQESAKETSKPPVKEESLDASKASAKDATASLPATSSAPSIIPEAPKEPAPAPSAPDAIDWAEASAFLDGLAQAQLAASKLPGLCLTVVKDGKVVHLKGYGYADLEKKIPVDPSKTLFRPGSVSKLLIWTALMQLAESGKLDLASDVNYYLKTFQVQAAFSKPVTAADLLTHTPGFEERSIGIVASSPEDLAPLGQALADSQPARVYPPGKTPAYSNWGAALAGYMIESISGMPYEQYIEENLFKPLSMTRSTFRQPLPEPLKRDMALGYALRNGVRQAQDFELIQLSPAGAMSATAADMAAFMIAHLQNGSYGDKRILKEESIKTMHGRRFSLDERLSGAAYGFFEQRLQGRRLLIHDGDTDAFHSLLALYPEQGLGLYISANGPYGNSADAARMQLLTAFLDRYFPGKDVAPAPAPGAAPAEASDVAGWYASNRVPFSTLDSVLRLFQELKISTQKDGVLRLKPARGPASIWTPVGPRLYRQQDGTNLLAFYPKDGPIEGFALDCAPFLAFPKVTRDVDTPPFQLGLLLACALVFLSALSWPIVSAARRGENPLRPYVPARETWLAAAAGLSFVLFYGLLATLVLPGLDSGLTWWMRAILGIPYLTALLCALMTGLWAWALAREYVRRAPRRWSLGGRIHYALLLAACLGLLWQLRHWRLIWRPM